MQSKERRPPARLRLAGHLAGFHSHETRDETQWEEIVSSCIREFGGLDILVNNAGVALIKPTLETSLTEFRAVQEVNVEGFFLGMRAVLPAIAERADNWAGGGAIINVSSIAGIVGSPRTIAYNALKGAVRLMTKSAALECKLLGLNVRVNSLHPGRVDTAMLRESSRGFGNIERSASPDSMCHPTEMAPAVVFLASDATSFMTGAELVGRWFHGAVIQAINRRRDPAFLHLATIGSGRRRRSDRDRTFRRRG